MGLDVILGGGLLLGAGGVIALLFRLLIASKDREHEQILKERETDKAELVAVKKSYQDIAAEAVRSAIETTNYYRKKEGLPPLIIAAPVIPESQSPSTEKQREAAHVQTLRASLANVKLETGQEPRPEPEKAVEPVAGGSVTAADLEKLKAGIEAAPAEIAEATADAVVDKLKAAKKK